MSGRKDRLGSVRVERDLNRLVRGERSLQVEPRAMQVLAHLLDHRGEVVPRAEIFSAVWRQADIGDDTLNRLVFDLRRAFRKLDPDLAPIETIRKVGYRVTASEPPVTERVFGRPRALVPCAAAVLAALLVFGWLLRPETAPPRRAEAAPFTAAVGFETYPAFAQDGRSVHFSCQPADAPRIALCRRGLDDAVTEIVLADGGEGPTPSPDGRRLAYQHLGDGCEIRVLAIASGEVTTIATCSERSDGSLDWSPDGTQVLFADRASASDPFRILSVPVSGGSPIAVTRPPAGIIGDLYPAVSPDGGRLAFFRASRAPTTSTYITPGIGEVRVLAMARGRRAEIGRSVPLTDVPARITGVTWFAGRPTWFSDEAATGYRLWAGEEGEAPAVLVDGFDGIPRQPTINNESVLVAEVWQADADLWTRSLGGRDAPRRLLSSTRFDFAPDVSADGRRIAWASSRDGRTRVWYGSPDGDAPEAAVPLAAGVSAEAPRFSPDGERLAFELRRDGRSTLAVHRFFDGSTETLDLPGESRVPAWAADGSALIHASDRGGAWQLWRFDLADGSLRQLTRAGGFASREYGAGAGIVFSRRGRPGLWRLAYGNDEPSQLLGILPAEYWGNWTLVGDTVYAAVNAPAPRIVAVSLTGGDPVTVLTLPQPMLREATNLAVDPIGGRVYYALRNRISADLIRVRLD